MASTSAPIKLKMIKEKEIACKIAKTKHFLLYFCRVPFFQVFGVLCVLVFSVERGTFKSFFHSPFCLVPAHIVRYSVPKGASSISLHCPGHVPCPSAVYRGQSYLHLHGCTQQQCHGNKGRNPVMITVTSLD